MAAGAHAPVARSLRRNLRPDEIESDALQNYLGLLPLPQVRLYLQRTNARPHRSFVPAAPDTPIGLVLWKIAGSAGLPLGPLGSPVRPDFSGLSAGLWPRFACRKDGRETL